MSKPFKSENARFYAKDFCIKHTKNPPSVVIVHNLCSHFSFRFFQMAIAIYHLAQVKPDDVVYMTLPLYHSTGGAVGTGQMLFRGCTVALRTKFSASQFWNDCIKHKATVSCKTPLQLVWEATE